MCTPVTYFLGAGTSLNGQAVSGLVRREVNRASGLYSGTSGGTPSGADDQLLAPEVIGLELHYFDGTEWQTTWDTSTKKGLPLAVEIAIEVQPEQRSWRQQLVFMDEFHERRSSIRNLSVDCRPAGGEGRFDFDNAIQ